MINEIYHSAVNRSARVFILIVFELASSFLFFSILPVSKVADWAKARCLDADYSLNIVQYFFFPLVGAVNAGIVLGIAVLLIFLHFPPLEAAIAAAILYPFMSGGFHLDGTSDTIDALFAYLRDRFEVITDPHVGALGFIWTMLLVLFQVSLHATLLFIWLTTGTPAYLALLVPAITSRVGSFYWLVKWYPQWHPQHLEHLFPSYYPESLLSRSYMVWCCVLPILVALAIWLWPIVVVPLCWSIIVTIGIGMLVLPRLVRVLGFIYGDCLGLCIVLTETVASFLLVSYYG